jgi:hypothetical protein
MKAGLWCEPPFTVEAEFLTRELADLPWLPGRSPRFTDEHLSVPLDWFVWLAKGAASEIVPAPAAGCPTYAKHVADAFRWWANSHGGGRIAAWICRANKIAWHVGPPTEPPHAFILTFTSDQGIWVLDAAFLGGSRGIYQIGPDDSGFWGLGVE